MALWRRLRRKSPPTARTYESVRAVLDFGATSLRAAIVAVLPTSVEILGVGTVAGIGGIARPGKVARRDELATLTDIALRQAERATMRAHDDLPIVADEGIVGLTGPLLRADSHVAYLRRANPVAPVYDGERTVALQTVQSQNLERLAQQATATRIRRTLVASQLVALMSVRDEEQIAAQRLPDSGRGVPGQAGDWLAVAICNLTWPSKGIEILLEVMQDVELTLCHAVPIVQALCAALPLPEAIVLDVGDEQTTIALAEAGVLSRMTTIEPGGRFITHQLQSGLGVEEAQAEEIKRRSSTEPPIIAEVLQRALGQWLRGVEQALLTLAGDATLPPHLYLAGGGAMLPDMLTRLQAHRWSQRLPFNSFPTVERLLPHNLRGLADPQGHLAHPAHVGLAALATWLAREPAPLQQELDAISEPLARAYGLR